LLAGETAAVAASIIKGQLAACFIGKERRKQNRHLSSKVSLQLVS
jgi:hypothetical protein